LQIFIADAASLVFFTAAAGAGIISASLHRQNKLGARSSRETPTFPPFDRKLADLALLFQERLQVAPQGR
jgi:hypothetical protein